MRPWIRSYRCFMDFCPGGRLSREALHLMHIKTNIYIYKYILIRIGLKCFVNDSEMLFNELEMLCLGF